MKYKRFIWTRRLYRKADSLCRFFDRHAHELPDEQPQLLRRYFDLWSRHPQRDDPLMLPMRLREHYNTWGGDIPF